MKPRLIAVVAAGIVLHSLAAGASLSSADIRAEVERAAKDYLGDFPLGVAVITRHYTRYSWSAEDFPRADISVRLAVPLPAPSQMLVTRPTFIQLFVRP